MIYLLLSRHQGRASYMSLDNQLYMYQDIAGHPRHASSINVPRTGVKQTCWKPLAAYTRRAVEGHPRDRAILNQSIAPSDIRLIHGSIHPLINNSERARWILGTIFCSKSDGNAYQSKILSTCHKIMTEAKRRGRRAEEARGFITPCGRGSRGVRSPARPTPKILSHWPIATRHLFFLRFRRRP